MKDIDDKVFQYTLEFSRDAGMDMDPRALKEGINRHMNSARTVVTNATLERIGHVHLSLIINTAARYDISWAKPHGVSTARFPACLGHLRRRRIQKNADSAYHFKAQIAARLTPLFID